MSSMITGRSSVSSADVSASLLDDAHSCLPELTRLRHALHQEPEVGLILPRTQERVLAALDGLGFEVTTGREATSVTAVLRGADTGGQGRRRTVLLRGDMDALPLQERTDLAYASQVEGAMHACGHDLHTAMLVGAAHLLGSRRHQLAGDVVFMFQPGEEGYDGARVMIDEGVLDAAGDRVDGAFGLHVMSGFEDGGTFFSRPGTAMSASAGLVVTVRGQGGHGSTPHTARNPLTTAAEMITALQTMVTQRFNAFDPVVVSVGMMRAGTKRNIIPDEATFEATLRCFSAEAKQRLRTEIPRLMEAIAAGHGQDVSVEIIDEYPAVVNHGGQAQLARHCVEELFGEARYQHMDHPMAASEDFSRLLEEVPGAFVFLSAVPQGQDPSSVDFNHSPHAVFDDAALPDGAALYARLALDFLACAS